MTGQASPPPIWILCGHAFVLMLGYGLTNAAGQSLFLAAYPSRQLAWAWLAVAAMSALAVAALGVLAARLPVGRLYRWASLTAAASLAALLLAQARGVPHAAFALYVWKDVYVVVLVELLWTFANVAFAAPAARRAYGLFCAAGSVGTILGSAALVPLAPAEGTLAALYLALPLLLLGAWGAAPLRHPDGAPGGIGGMGSPAPRLGAGLRLLGHSPMLRRLMAWVVCVQVTVTLMDFQFNEIVARDLPATDARTALLGRVFAAINALALALQLGTHWLLQHVGAGRLLCGMPAALGVAMVWLTCQPGLAAASAVKIVGKTADYSLLRAVKELIYIPLSYPEKTQGKAFVDIFTYRAAKAGASLLVLGLAGRGAGVAVSWANLALCGAWLWLSLALWRQHRRGAAAPVAPPVDGTL